MTRTLLALICTLSLAAIGCDPQTAKNGDDAASDDPQMAQGSDDGNDGDEDGHTVRKPIADANDPDGDNAEPTSDGDTPADDPPLLDEVQKDIEEAASTLADFVTDKKEDYVAEANRNLKLLDKQIDELGKRTGEEASEQLKQLQEKREHLATKLDEFGDATADDWQDVRREVDQAWSDLHDAYQEAVETSDDEEAPNEDDSAGESSDDADQPADGAP